jgi:hypothetical protein
MTDHNYVSGEFEIPMTFPDPSCVSTGDGGYEVLATTHPDDVVTITASERLTGQGPDGDLDGWVVRGTAYTATGGTDMDADIHTWADYTTSTP